MTKNYYDLKFNLFIAWASLNRITKNYYDLKFN